MNKSKRSPSNNIVPHPRFGSESLNSGVQGISREAILRSYWGYGTEQIFPESVLMADANKQNYSVFPRQCYVDMLKTCRSCARPFIFFAAEQKHWFEVLGFYVDADCVHCPECRQNRRAAKREVQRYSQLVQIAEPTNLELQELVNIAGHLFAQGTLKNLARLGQLKNRASQHIPDYAGTAALAHALQQAQATKKA